MSFEQELIEIRDTAVAAKLAAYDVLAQANNAVFEAIYASNEAWQAASKVAHEAAQAFDAASEAAHQATMRTLRWRTAGSAAGAILSAARWAAMSR